jgi:hypothetical protein
MTVRRSSVRGSASTVGCVLTAGFHTTKKPEGSTPTPANPSGWKLLPANLPKSSAQPRCEIAGQRQRGLWVSLPHLDQGRVPRQRETVAGFMDTSTEQAHSGHRHSPEGSAVDVRLYRLIRDS